MFPSGWYGFVLSRAGWISLLGLVIVGFMLARTLLRRWPVAWPRTLGLLASAALLLTLCAQLLTMWILRIDPERATETIPLPPVFQDSTILMTVALCVVSPVLCGFLLGGLASPTGRQSRSMATFGAAVAAYSIWVLPWVVHVVFD
jgi:hypothetical protein